MIGAFRFLLWKSLPNNDFGAPVLTTQLLHLIGQKNQNVGALKKLIFIGTLLVIILGMGLILVADYSQHRPQGLIDATRLLIYVTGLSILMVILRDGLRG